MLQSSQSLFAVAIPLMSFLFFIGFSYDAYAVTVITVDDEASCEALPLTGGTATWGSARCTIPEGATLQIHSGEVLDLRVGFSSLGTINNLQGGTINIAAGLFVEFCCDSSAELNNFGIVNIAAGSLSVGGFGAALNNYGTINIAAGGGLGANDSGVLNNYGTINIRAGASLGLGNAGFYNAPEGIVNNYGGMGGSSDDPSFRNVGTINNFDTGRIDAHSESSWYNDPQGVINNYGLMDIDFSGLRNDGILNNYATANLGGGGVTPAPRQGTLNNFGSLDIRSYRNLETISNHGKITIVGGTSLVNDGTIINKAAGVIENFGEFSNPGIINNQGLIATYCGGSFINSGTFTGTPVKNSCESVPPAIAAPADVTLTTTGTRLNLCQNIPVSSISAIGDDGAGNVPTNTLDNNLGTRWSRGGHGAWIKPDLGSTKVICNVDIAWYKGDQRIYRIDISVSNDGENFKKVFTGRSSGTTLSSERYEFEDSVGRFIKITITATSTATGPSEFSSITEIDVNGYTSLGLPLFSDNLDPSPLVKNNVPANGLPLGTNPVTWTAIDINGNTNSDGQLVKVVAGDTTGPTISITSPATGSTINGPSNGVKVSLKGTAADAGSGIQKVELKSLKSGVGVHGYQQATPGSFGNWGTWSHTLTFTQTGTYTITARATDKAGNQNWYSITVKIAFQSDTTIPTVSITSPQSGASFSGPSSVPKKINLAGIAADSGTGVQKVELKSLKSGVVVHGYQQATPGAPGNWGTWSHTLTFTQTGTYTITARATDKAGNQNWYSITVKIAFQSDTTIPTVSITSPQNGASFSGPSNVPKKISLAGTAADSGSGVQKVELKSLRSGVAVHGYQQASTSNNWSTWTQTLSFTQAGTYTITARATDNAGNQNWHSITVNISLR